MAAFGVERDHDSLAADSIHKAIEKRPIDAAVLKRRAADDDFLRAPACNFHRLCHRADSAAYSDAQFSLFRRGAQLANELGVASLSHRGVQVDHMNHRIAAEAIEQAENVVHCELSVAPVHQLNG